MNRRSLTAIALTVALSATAALVPAAHAGNVAWGVSVGGPGFSVSAGQPANYAGGYYGGRGYYRAPFVPVVRTYYRPYFRPYAPYAYRAIVVAPVPVYFPTYYAPPASYPYYTRGTYGGNYGGSY